MIDSKSQRDTKPGKPEPKLSDRMPPGYCMFTCNKCGCGSRWYAPIEQEQSPLREMIAGDASRWDDLVYFDHWEIRQLTPDVYRTRCSACSSTLPYVPEPVKAVKK